MPFLGVQHMPKTAYIYTIGVDVYAFRLAFSIKTHCILHHFTLRLAPKRTVFSTKTQCVLHQIAVRFGAKCTVFCCEQLKI